MAAENQPASRKRTLHQLETPYSAVLWPEISPENQDIVLEHLCSLLTPVGQYRCAHVKASKGKKAARRSKRTQAQDPDASAEDSASTSPPPPPDIIHSIDVGLNSISRNLVSNQDGARSTADSPPRHKQYAMVFVSRGDQSSTFNCHFPKMVAAASRDVSFDTKIRLVGFSKPCSERLSHSLGVARVSSLAIAHGAPGSDALWNVVKELVGPVDTVWLNGSRNNKYLPTKINAIETIAGPKREKKS